MMHKMDEDSDSAEKTKEVKKSKSLLKGFYKIEDLKLNPSLYVPF